MERRTRKSRSDSVTTTMLLIDGRSKNTRFSCSPPCTHTAVKTDLPGPTMTTTTTTPTTPLPQATLGPHLDHHPSRPLEGVVPTLCPKIPLPSTFTTDIATIATAGHRPVLVPTSHPSLDVSHPHRQITPQTMGYPHALVARAAAPQPGSLEANLPRRDATPPRFQQPRPSPNSPSANVRLWHANVFRPRLKRMSSTRFQPILSALRI